MEVSALKQPQIALPGRSPLLRLQSDERLVALVRRGQHEAFEALVARYQSRLLAFCRHMLSSREDAEDVLQEVFAAAFNAILADEREINVRPWLYRIARNRSLNHLRRATAIGVDSMDTHFAENGLSTGEQVMRRESFRQLISDVHQLPETQRSALLLREIDALSYEQIADAMETTVPSVKSLLVRARISLAEAAEARKLSCEQVRLELGRVAEGLTKMDPLVRRHTRDCERCNSLRQQLRANNRALAAIMPVGPLLLLKKLILTRIGSTAGAGAGHVAGAGGATAGAGAGASAGATASLGATAGATAAGASGAGGLITAGAGALATKTVAGLAAAALVTAGAVAANNEGHHHHQASPARLSHAAPVAVAAVPHRAPAPSPPAYSLHQPQTVAKGAPAGAHRGSNTLAKPQVRPVKSAKMLATTHKATIAVMRTEAGGSDTETGGMNADTAGTTTETAATGVAPEMTSTPAPATAARPQVVQVTAGTTVLPSSPAAPGTMVTPAVPDALPTTTTTTTTATTPTTTVAPTTATAAPPATTATTPPTTTPPPTTAPPATAVPPATATNPPAGNPRSPPGQTPPGQTPTPEELATQTDGPDAVTGGTPVPAELTPR